MSRQLQIDARGLACPGPVIAVKKALEEIADGVVSIVVDNEIAKENITKFAGSQQCGVSISRQDNDFVLTIVKGSGGGSVAAAVQKEADGAGAVYVIGRDKLGEGNDELGAVLMKGFLYTLSECKPRPQALIFMNGGVLLTLADSPVLEHVQRLEESGTVILSCGTCLDYYHSKDKLACGSITNMYTIVEQMTAAGKVITL